MSNPAMRLATGNESKALPKRFAFTAGRLRAVTCPESEERVWVYDARVPALAYCVARGGARAFYVVKWVGRTIRLRLADGSVPIDDARKLAQTVLADIARGVDPQAKRVEDRRTASVATLFEDYKRRHNGKLKSLAYYESVFKSWAGWLASRKAKDVTRQDVERRHSEVGEANGPYAANRLLAVLSIAFNASGIANPCEGVRKFPEPSRERFLSPDELARFNAALAEQPQPWRDYFGLLVATAFRKSAVCAMRWQDVDLERRTWSVPSYQSKNGKQVVLPLTDEAVTILKARSNPREDSPYVFPSYSKAGHIVEPKTAWRALCAAANLEGVRVHDIRRTRGAYMAASGLSDRQIANALGQSTTAATAVYARLREADARSASEAGMALMRKLTAEAMK